MLTESGRNTTEPSVKDASGFKRRPQSYLLRSGLIRIGYFLISLDRIDRHYPVNSMGLQEAKHLFIQV